MSKKLKTNDTQTEKVVKNIDTEATEKKLEKTKELTITENKTELAVIENKVEEKKLKLANYSDRLPAYIIDFTFARLLIIPVLILVGIIGLGFNFLEDAAKDSQPIRADAATYYIMPNQATNQQRSNLQREFNPNQRQYLQREFFVQQPKSINPVLQSEFAPSRNEQEKKLAPACAMQSEQKLPKINKGLTILGFIKSVIATLAYLLIAGLFFIGDIIYGMVADYLFGNTLGRKIMGLKVVNLENETPSDMTMIGRQFVKLTPFNPVISLLMMEVNKNKQSFHDHLTGTKVVFEEEEI